LPAILAIIVSPTPVLAENTLTPALEPPPLLVQMEIVTIPREWSLAVAHEVLGEYDWDVNIAYSVMMCESGGNPEVVNDNPLTGDYSIGLFQVNLYGANALSRPSEEWLKDPFNNINYAYELYSKGGFAKHWRNCLNKGQSI